LAGVAPGDGTGEGENAGAKAFETKSRGERSDFFIYERGELLEKEDFKGSLLGEGGEVDGWGGRDEFEVASDGRAADPCEGATEDEFKGFSFDPRPSKVMFEVVDHGTGDFGGKRPCEVAGLSCSFFDG
jgi:hypothetical protein